MMTTYRIPAISKSIIFKLNSRLITGRLRVSFDHNTMQSSITEIKEENVEINHTVHHPIKS